MSALGPNLFNPEDLTRHGFTSRVIMAWLQDVIQRQSRAAGEL